MRIIIIYILMVMMTYVMQAIFEIQALCARCWLAKS